MADDGEERGKESRGLSTTSQPHKLRLLSAIAPTAPTCTLRDISLPRPCSPVKLSAACAARTQDHPHVTDPERCCNTGSEVRA